MQISAQVRYLDYTARSLNTKRNRRGTNEPLLIPVVDERAEEEQRRRDARQAALINAVVEDDEGVEYSRELSAAVTPPAASEASAALSPLVTVAPWASRPAPDALSTTRKPKDQAKASVRFRNDAFFALLDQVVAEA